MRRPTGLVAAAVLAMAAPAAATSLEGDWILLHLPDQSGEVYDLYLIRPDGTGLVNLTNGVADDYVGAVSPDGSTIAVASYDGATTEIWVMDVEGGNRRRLTTSGGSDVGWTPDGRIVYSQARTIRVMAVDGTGDALVVEGLPQAARNLAVSPDGSTVVFDVQVETTREIYSVPLGGGPVVQLTTEGGFEPDWSPDGSRIVFTTFRDDYGDNVWVMDPDGSDQRNLVASPFNDFHASWSPDGGRIVFESVRSEDFAISIVDLATGTSTDVVTRSTIPTFRAPVWVRIAGSVPPATVTTATSTETTVATADTTTPTGGENDSSFDPLWVALFGAVVATATIGVVLTTKSPRRREPPPPPAAPGT